MSKTGIFYASKGGVTETFAKQIAEKLGADLHNMKDTKVDAIADYQNVVLMSSSYFFGALMEDWGGKVKLLHTVDFSGKNVAIVGVGSQERHPDSFCSGAADFYDKLRFSGARFVGDVCLDRADILHEAVVVHLDTFGHIFHVDKHCNHFFAIGRKVSTAHQGIDIISSCE